MPSGLSASANAVRVRLRRSESALAKVARTPKDYFDVYKTILSNCDYPVILHWLGDMFDPQLFGYWSATNFEDSLEVVLEIIEENERKV